LVGQLKHAKTAATGSRLSEITSLPWQLVGPDMHISRSSIQRLLAIQRHLWQTSQMPVNERSFLRSVILRLGARHLQRAFERRSGAYITFRAQIGEKLNARHNLLGVFIADGAVIGSNVTLYHHVTIGSVKGKDGKLRSPVIGDDVFIGAGAIILGAATIANGARIGAGVVLTDVDVPAGAVIVNKSAYDLTNGRFVYLQGNS
jgi:serine acetyltransferase